jgi:hypothetical protein
MKQPLITIIMAGLLIFGLSGAIHAAGPISLIAGGIKQVEMEMNLPDLQKAQLKTKGGDFSLLTVAGHGYSTELGKPRLPVISEWVEIPQGAQATAQVTVLDSKESSLADFGLKNPIVPVQPPVPKIPGAEDRIAFQKDETIYSLDAFYGRGEVVLSEPVQMRSKRAVLVSFWPLSYNPATGMVKIVTKARITVNLSGGNMTKTRSVYSKYASHVYDRYIQASLLNDLSSLSAGKLQPPAPVNELIIVVDSLYAGIQSLTDWDTRKGYHVTVTKTSEIPGGADTTHIREYIQSVYDGANPPDFVLLVGDINGIPAHRSSEMDLPYTDLYYSTMSGSDYIPDLYVGRISAANSAQLSNYVAKYLDYQYGNWGPDQSWMGKGYFTASDDGGYHLITEQTNDYCMALSRSHGMTCDSLYAYYGTGTPVATAFNDGRTVMAYTGHGSQTSWGGPSFTQGNVNDLTNAYKSTFVTSFACLTGDFSYGECFGETWIRAANKGAIAFWGSSVYSYWTEDDILQRRMFDAFLDSGYVWIGGMTVKAKLDFGKYFNWDSYNAGGVTVRRYFEEYNILGNAGVDMYTQQPLVLSVTHPSSVPTGSSQVSVNVKAGSNLCAEALVAIYRPSTKTLLASGYTDPAGNALLAINPGASDSLAITVTAHNCAPYRGQIQAADGAYVWYLKHSISDPAGNNDGMLNPGETAGVTLWLKNFGTDTAKAVTSKLRTEDLFVTVSDSIEAFGDIAPGDSLSVTGFAFGVSSSAPDSHSVGFSVECRDSRDSAWNSAFSELIRAPVLAYSSYLVKDPAPGGNGNCAFEPGESDSIKVTLLNRGGQKAIGVSAIISTSDPYLTILAGNSSYGDIPAYEAASSVPSYYIAAGAPPSTPYVAWIRIDISAFGGAYVKTDSFKLVIGSTGFFDDVESEAVISTYTVEPSWHVTGQNYYSSGHSWWCGDSATGGYFNNQNSSLVTSDIILGAGSTLSFWHKYSTELDYDYCYVEYSTNGGGNWIRLATYNGFQPAWSLESFDLSSLASGTVIKARFLFSSDVSIVDEGWYLDDIKIEDSNGVNDSTDSLLSLPVKLGYAYPNPSRGITAISYQLPQSARVDLKIYNIQGQLVKTLESKAKQAGFYRVPWDGLDEKGQRVSTGVYFYRFNAGNYSSTGKLMIIK